MGERKLSGYEFVRADRSLSAKQAQTLGLCWKMFGEPKEMQKGEESNPTTSEYELEK